jgi:hypothetical protein
VYVVPDNRTAARQATTPDVTVVRPPRDTGRRWLRPGGRRA